MPCDRREFLLRVAAAGASLKTARLANAGPADWKAGWLDPPRSCRPHTRWWWPGSAVTKAGIDWQLEQMHAQGIGGVEICCVWEMYRKGNIPYLSDRWLEMVRHAIEKAATLDMEVALTFGPGWDLGGFWVPPQERSKVLAAAHLDLEGPREFNGPLPAFSLPPDAPKGGWANKVGQPRDWTAPDDNQVVAVVAGRLDGERIDAASLQVLTDRARRGRFQWNVAAGRWRLAVFRLLYTGQQNSAQNFRPENWIIDHFNKRAVLHYCNYLNTAFAGGFGEYLGRTVDSYFVDSWEVIPLYNTLLWSNTLLDDFLKYKGYDLTPYLPAIWWDIGELTPRIRYDVNEFLHWLALERVFGPLAETMARYGVQARIQPHYRFTEEIIQGAGAAPRPETEVTTAHFTTLADPRKATVAGARFYGRQIVSAEAFTFLHRERYRTTLEEMKRATDAFLREGVTQFYNHGYVYTPEMGPAPSRDIPWANRISHINPWWRYYKHLAVYTARCCWLLRQGQFVGDVLLYSPQATAWTKKVLYWTQRRVMDYGDVPKTLVANGYDYDPVNDDVLQNRARIENGRIRIRDLSYRFLILPKIEALPVETMRVIRDFARAGGVVIALETLPSASVGLRDWQRRDSQVRKLVDEVFRSGPGHFLPDYKIAHKELNPGDQTYRPTPPLNQAQKKLLAILRADTPPDFELEGGAQSDGLTFLHRRAGDRDIYFVTNLQPKAVKQMVTFRVSGKAPERWDPMTGAIEPVERWRPAGKRTAVWMELTPWASTILVFRPDAPARKSSRPAQRSGPPLEIQGRWTLTIDGVKKQLSQLVSWTEDEATRYFSGSAAYEIEFDAPEDYARPGRKLTLDLGKVGEVAEVWLNGRWAGVCWMQPYRLDVTGLVQAGPNILKVIVTNTLINRVAGMKELPPVPPELIPHYGGEGGRYTLGRERARREMGFSPLPPSGLLGPVTLR